MQYKSLFCFSLNRILYGPFFSLTFSPSFILLSFIISSLLRLSGYIALLGWSDLKIYILLTNLTLCRLLIRWGEFLPIYCLWRNYLPAILYYDLLSIIFFFLYLSLFCFVLRFVCKENCTWTPDAKLYLFSTDGKIASELTLAFAAGLMVSHTYQLTFFLTAVFVSSMLKMASSD